MTYEECFIRYDIHPKFWAEMQAIAMADTRPGAELQVRLNYVTNYQDCLHAITAGKRKQSELNPALTPFQSIEVPK